MFGGHATSAIVYDIVFVDMEPAKREANGNSRVNQFVDRG